VKRSQGNWLIKPTIEMVSGERVNADASHGKAMAVTPFPVFEIKLAPHNFQ
jgi:hypothetical protein